MKIRFLFATLALLLMLALGSAACGGDDDGGDSPGGTGQDGGNDGNGDDGGDDDDGPTDPPDPTIPPNLGEELTLEEYFTTIDGIFETADAATDDAQAELDATLGSDDTLDGQIEAIQGYLETELEVFSDAIGRLDSITPPDEVAQDHDDFITAVSDAAAAASNLSFALDDAGDEEEANTLVDEFETTVNEITERGDEACFNLQAFADANSINVDLSCED